ncbi:MAG TPA: O-acetyl-ADP-ribose deacetylase [Dokdonella sp.]|uniref:O-acetyl-ADP-ribose deacetylase n=1 Tax=Dokdonella sp. TaxID=2291710 RepID=UPI002D7F73C1|nr:O-acetyl-ADP-ribose deacetylase [Dokdonella sp.]HET9033195.1 O-acetyl-ADP-ribose deacetylase [Dokdonella sp.]
MIRILETDITTQRVDAIVNAANEGLLGGGGVDGAIHQAAGAGLLAACRALAQVRPGVRCPTGEARITPGFDLPARYIIHTVGPVWEGGLDGEPALLANCYRNVLRLAHEHSLKSLAFPAISCGVFGYPPDKAARIALNELGKPAHADFDIRICCRGDEMIDSYRRAGLSLLS